MYPTAPKLIAGLLFAALAWWLSDLMRPYMPMERPLPMLGPLAAGAGFLCGWNVVGRKAGRGYVSAIGLGWTAAAATGFWTITIWAGYEMVQRSISRFYREPMEALLAWVRLSLDFAAYLLHVTPLASAVVGAAFCALVTEYLARRIR